MACRPLTDNEILKVTDALGNSRNKLLFLLGLYTGFRISELLSLKIKDVLSSKGTTPLEVAKRLTVKKSSMKGKSASRSVILHSEAIRALKQHLSEQSVINPEYPLFSYGDNKPLSRHGAHRILKIAYSKAGLDVNTLATHSMRKTFAKKVYNALDFDLVNTQKALGHSSILNTIKYLQTDNEAVDSAILAI